MATDLAQVIRAIGRLTQEEQQQAPDTLDDLLGAARVTPLQRRLLNAGLIRHVGDPVTRAEHIRRFEPVELDGELLSAQIVRERR
jgi:hypothetical protein